MIQDLLTLCLTKAIWITWLGALLEDGRKGSEDPVLSSTLSVWTKSFCQERGGNRDGKGADGRGKEDTNPGRMDLRGRGAFPSGALRWIHGGEDDQKRGVYSCCCYSPFSLHPEILLSTLLTSTHLQSKFFLSPLSSANVKAFRLLRCCFWRAPAPIKSRQHEEKGSVGAREKV